MVPARSTIATSPSGAGTDPRTFVREPVQVRSSGLSIVARALACAAVPTLRTLRLLDPIKSLVGAIVFTLEDFLPDLEILKPPDEPGPNRPGSFYLAAPPASIC